MSYTPQDWQDNEAGGTPINAARLDTMEAGIAGAHATADAAAATLAGGTLIHQSDFGWNLLKHFGTGLGEGDDDTAALQDFFDACGVAYDAVGVIPPSPTGVYLNTGDLAYSAHSHIEGPDRAVRYHGYAPDPPRTAGALRLLPGTSALAVLRPQAAFTAGSLTDLCILGDNHTTAALAPVHGILFALPETESAINARNVSIIGMSGHGITGNLWAQKWASGLYVGGCGGYGINVSGADRATDVWIHQAIFNGNVAGCINIDSTASSGMVRVTGGTRLERSGWNPATNGLVPGAAAGGVGLRIRGNLFNSSFDITTDANSGPGLSIVQTSGRSVHDVAVKGILARDGWWDMVNGASGGTNPQPGLEIIGFVGGSVDRVNLSGLSITGGKARDDSTAPAYYHPAIGIKTDQISFLRWADAYIDPAIATTTQFVTEPWRSQIDGRLGNTSVAMCPIYSSAASRPGESGMPGAVPGMWGLATYLSPARPIYYIGGGVWRDAAGTVV